MLFPPFDSKLGGHLSSIGQMFVTNVCLWFFSLFYFHFSPVVVSHSLSFCVSSPLVCGRPLLFFLHLIINTAPKMKEGSLLSCK